MKPNAQTIAQWTKNVLKHSPMVKGISLNPKGRPKKQIWSMIAQMKRDGLQRISVAEIIESCEWMLVMTQPQLKALFDNPESSMFVKIIAKSLLDGLDSFMWHRWVDMLEKIIQRAHGRIGKQEEGWDGPGNIDSVTINVITINDRKDSPWFTGVASIPQELHKSEEN